MIRRDPKVTPLQNFAMWFFFWLVSTAIFCAIAYLMACFVMWDWMPVDAPARTMFLAIGIYSAYDVWRYKK